MLSLRLEFSKNVVFFENANIDNDIVDQWKHPSGLFLPIRTAT
jgi:hypothetical protein